MLKGYLITTDKILIQSLIKKVIPELPLEFDEVHMKNLMITKKNNKVKYKLTLVLVDSAFLDTLNEHDHKYKLILKPDKSFN